MMKLTDEQQEKAIGLRSLLKTYPLQCDSEAWESYIDCTRALAKILDGLDYHVKPLEMTVYFDEAFKAIAKAWTCENRRLFLFLMNNDEELLQLVYDHPNCGKILSSIIERSKQVYGGKLPFGTQYKDIDISDILTKGMTDT